MKTFTFFLKDDSIHEITAINGESALLALAKQFNTSRYWMLDKIEQCLSPE